MILVMFSITIGRILIAVLVSSRSLFYLLVLLRVEVEGVPPFFASCAE